MKFKLLLIDDDEFYLSCTKDFFESHGYEVKTTSSGEEGIQISQRYEFALVILDFHMSGLNGAQTAEAILKNKPNTFILFLSGAPERDAIKLAWKAGAISFIEKGGSSDELLKTVSGWCEKFKETFSTIEKDSHDMEILRLSGMVGRSEALYRVAQKMEKYKRFREPVLILGETGTGKELVAKGLSNQGERPFFVVNCASFNGHSDLLESELFGHQKGSFTGADRDKKGIFEQAEGGTVFLDEIHTLSLSSQQKLLRAIQSKVIRPLGSAKEISIDVRFIAASKPDLEEMTTKFTFLPDLFERLNVLKIDIAPLCERVEDIEPLVSYFCDKYKEETGHKKTFSSKALQCLLRYSWPRNVRELENQVKRLCIDVESEVIKPEHLDGKFFSPQPESECTGSFKQKKKKMLKDLIESTIKTSPSHAEAARRLKIPDSSLRYILNSVK